jgi:hypothetical protein
MAALTTAVRTALLGGPHRKRTTPDRAKQSLLSAVSELSRVRLRLGSWTRQSSACAIQIRFSLRWLNSGEPSYRSVVRMARQRSHHSRKSTVAGLARVQRVRMHWAFVCRAEFWRIQLLLL